MSLPVLDNLVRIGQLKAEPRNEAEVRRMLALARSVLPMPNWLGKVFDADLHFRSPGRPHS